MTFRVLGIFGLNPNTREDELEKIFSAYGPVQKVVLVLDRPSDRSKGFGFIYFKDQESATKARTEGNKMEIDGRTVRIDYSRTTRAHDPTPGRYMGRETDRPRRDFGRRDDRRFDDRRYRDDRYDDRDRYR